MRGGTSGCTHRSASSGTDCQQCLPTQGHCSAAIPPAPPPAGSGGGRSCVPHIGFKITAAFRKQNCSDVGAGLGGGGAVGAQMTSTPAAARRQRPAHPPLPDTPAFRPLRRPYAHASSSVLPVLWVLWPHTEIGPPPHPELRSQSCGARTQEAGQISVGLVARALLAAITPPLRSRTECGRMPSHGRSALGGWPQRNNDCRVASPGRGHTHVCRRWA